MPVSLSVLPYARSALEPLVTADTLDVHYGKHHAGYVAKLNELLQGTDSDHLPLSEIVRRAWKTGDMPIFNNAAQAWNHEFYWASLCPEYQQPTGPIASMIKRDFGDIEHLESTLIDVATNHFGSGWVWLVLDRNRLKVVSTANADSPLLYQRQLPLLTIDVWEHAYYLDYLSDRRRYVESLVKSCLNWKRANIRLKSRASGWEDLPLLRSLSFRTPPAVQQKNSDVAS